MNAVSLITGFLVVVISAGSSLAQDSTRPPAKSNAIQAQTEEQTTAKQFDDLRHSRIAAVNAIAKLSQTKQAKNQLISSRQDEEKLLEERLSNLSDPPPAAEVYDKRLTGFKNQQTKRSDDLAAAKTASPRNESDIEGLESQLKDIKEIIDETESRKEEAAKETQQYNSTKEDLTKKIDKAKTEINDIRLNIDREQSESDKKTQDLQEMEDQITVLFTKSDQTNSFKLNMSLAFTGLVSLVIIGFFVVALYDDKVRTSIFSNESGIQFITLFSLVIAIILFGIVNILEGRELAALLGGLSGYILGRGTGSERTATQQASSPTTQQALNPTPVAP